MTVREFIEKHLDATMNMMTPGGYVTVTPVIAAGLLRGEGVASHPGANECWAKVTAEKLLPQEIVQCKEHPEIPNCIYMITGYAQEHGKKVTQFAGTMQSRCWRGQHSFDYDDISFEQEIIADDGKLNFYVPIYFDAYGIFGDAVSKLEPDDSYNVYANYDLEDDIDALLEGYGLAEDNGHRQQLRWEYTSIDNGKSPYAEVELKFLCGCHLNTGNIRTREKELRKQFGLELRLSGLRPTNDPTCAKVGIKRNGLKDKEKELK